LKIGTFEEIIAWQKALDFSILVYLAFKDLKDFSFKDQIQRAAISIMNNIAEGFERQTDREFRQFLFIAKGSCAEVRSMLYFAVSLNYIQIEVKDQLMEAGKEISKILAGLIKALKVEPQN